MVCLMNQQFTLEVHKINTNMYNAIALSYSKSTAPKAQQLTFPLHMERQTSLDIADAGCFPSAADGLWMSLSLYWLWSTA